MAGLMATKWGNHGIEWDKECLTGQMATQWDRCHVAIVLSDMVAEWGFPTHFSLGRQMAIIIGEEALCN